jgi:hypothetical protein
MRKLLLVSTGLCVTLTGCSAHLYGNQASSGGTVTTTTTSAIAASARAGGTQLSFSSGVVPAPGAPGGQLVVNSGAGAAMLIGVLVVDAVSQLAYRLASPPSRPAAAPASIMETCSCFGYKPVMRDE